MISPCRHLQEEFLSHPIPQQTLKSLPNAGISSTCVYLLMPQVLCLCSAHRDGCTVLPDTPFPVCRKPGTPQGSTQVYFLYKYLPPPDFPYLLDNWIYLSLTISLPLTTRFRKSCSTCLSLRLNNSSRVRKHTFPAFL